MTLSVATLALGCPPLDFYNKNKLLRFKPQLHGHRVTQSYTRVPNDTTPISQGMGLAWLVAACESRGSLVKTQTLGPGSRVSSSLGPDVHFRVRRAHRGCWSPNHILRAPRLGYTEVKQKPKVCRAQHLAPENVVNEPHP